MHRSQFMIPESYSRFALEEGPMLVAGSCKHGYTASLIAPRCRDCAARDPQGHLNCSCPCSQPSNNRTAREATQGSAPALRDCCATVTLPASRRTQNGGLACRVVCNSSH
jgi:hypothetical protein